MEVEGCQDIPAELPGPSIHEPDKMPLVQAVKLDAKGFVGGREFYSREVFREAEDFDMGRGLIRWVNQDSPWKFPYYFRVSQVYSSYQMVLRYFHRTGMIRTVVNVNRGTGVWKWQRSQGNAFCYFEGNLQFVT